MENTNYTVINNEQNQQFEIVIDGEKAVLEYRWYKKNLALMHTTVPEQYEGKGIASALAKYALAYAKSNKLLIMVYCPFVGSYIKRHPEYKPLINTDYVG
jgi:uncharacterized protein